MQLAVENLREFTMTRQGQSFNQFIDSYEESASKRERRIYEAKRAQYAIANQIIELRKAMNMTQKDLARRTGVSQPEISRIEQGTANPTVGTIGRLAEGLRAHVVLRADDTSEIPHPV